MTKFSTFAILSDIHGNIDALDAVLADMESLGVGGLVCLGDIVGYGAEPGACVRAIRERCIVSVLGNHEAMFLFCADDPERDLGRIIGKPLALARQQLTADEATWLETLPLIADLEACELVHSSLHEPQEFHYIFTHDEASAHFAVQKRPVSFHGHSHLPCIWELGERHRVQCFKAPEEPAVFEPGLRYAVNVGSVGQPRDSDPRASYAIYDLHERSILIRRVPYDIGKAQDRIRKARLAASSSRRLSAGR